MNVPVMLLLIPLGLTLPSQGDAARVLFYLHGKIVEDAKEICVHGKVLSIYEMSDELAGSCAVLADRCSAGIARYKEIELNLGVGHGMVYRPFEEWVTPALEWSMNE